MVELASIDDAATFCGTSADDPVLLLVRQGALRAVLRFLQWDPLYGSHTRYYPRGDVGGQYAYQVDDTPPLSSLATYGRLLAGSDLVGLVGGATKVLQLDDKWVIVSAVEVWEKAGAVWGQAAAFDATSKLTAGSGFAVESWDGYWSKSGQLSKKSGVWHRDPGSIKTVYSSGFSEEELAGTGGQWDASDIRFAALLSVQRAYNEQLNLRRDPQRGAPGVLVSENIGGYSYSHAAGTQEKHYGAHVTLPGESMRLLQYYRRYGRIM